MPRQVASAKKRPAKEPSSKPTKKGAAKRAKTGKASRAEGPTGALRDFCRSLPGTTEDIKWGDNLIFSVGAKMYAGFDVDSEHNFAFKSEEEEFMGLIQIEGIIPAPYMAKHLWVAVRDRKALKNDEWKRLLKKAHALVAAKLPAKTRRQILGDDA